MQRTWPTSIRSLLGPTPSKPSPSASTIELGSRYQWVSQNESQSNTEREQDVNDEDFVNPDASQGVQKAEAVALVWNKKSAYVTYAWIYVCMFMFGIQSSVSEEAGLYGTTTNNGDDYDAQKSIMIYFAVDTVLSTVLKLPVARLLNIWSRTAGFLIFTGVYMIGLIILAACDHNNYRIANVGNSLVRVGISVLNFIFLILVTDITELRHRAIAIAFIQTPLLWDIFPTSLFGESFSKSHWRWAYWGFAIIMLVILCLLAGIFYYYLRVAEVRGVYKRRAPSGRSIAQSTYYYIQEFDLIGHILLKAAFILLLVPFTVVDYAPKKYASPIFIAPFVVAVFLLGLFGFWEQYGAQSKMVDISALKKPEMIGCFTVTLIQCISYQFWEAYIVGALNTYYKVPASSAPYVIEIHSVSSLVGGIFFGIAVLLTQRFKAICLYIGLPLMIFGIGLMINVHDGGGSSNIAYIVGCYVLIGLAEGTLTIGTQLAITVYMERESIPIMLFFWDMCNTVGEKIGFQASQNTHRSIYTSTLKEALPSSNKTISDSLLSDISASQTDFPIGPEIRAAVKTAWEVYLPRTYIIAIAILVAGFPAVAVWKNIHLSKKQNKGVMI